MKKILITLLAFAAFVSLAACSNSASSTGNHKDETVTFHALNGEIKIPKNPQRVVIQNYPDEGLALGANVVGTDAWSVVNPYLSSAQKKNLKNLGAPSFNLQKLIAEKPDLIVTVDKTQVAEYEKIAPTVLVNYQQLSSMDKDLNYFAQLLNRESEKVSFEKSFDKAAKTQQEKLTKAGITPGKNTISLLELQGDKIYAFGANFARGGQALTRGLGFKASSAMAKLSNGAGYAEVNAEALGQFDADYIFVDFSTADASQYQALQQNPIWKNLQAVKKGHVITMDYNKVYFFGGPIATKAELPLYTNAILSQRK